jgi:purine-cytosine permease-like protein
VAVSTLPVLETEAIEPKSAEEDSFIERPVPLQKRYGTFSMGLLWVTMMTTFPTCLLGFEWYRQGFTFSQVLTAILVGASIVFCYTSVAAYMGAITGLNYALLAKHVFGRIGSKVVCAAWSTLFFLWYAYMSGSMAVALKGLIAIPLSVPVLSVIMAILMSFNNIFGFKGVTNFARYLGAPCIIMWISYTFCKASIAIPPAIFVEHGKQTLEAAFTTITPLIVGACLWGNEPDFWRFAKPQKLGTVVPIMISVVIGEVLFPLTAWMVAYLGHVSDTSAALGFLNSYTFGTNGLLAAAMLVISYFAVNDGNMYGAINGFENLFHSRRGPLIIPMILLSCLLTLVLVNRSDALDICATFNAFLLPCVSIIIGIEYFFFRSILHRVGEDAEFKAVSWTAITALAVAWCVGIFTSGNVPHTEALHFGIWPLFAWFAAALVYIPLRLVRFERADLLKMAGQDRPEAFAQAEAVPEYEAAVEPLKR